MKIFYIGILRIDQQGGAHEALELASVREMSSFSFFERSSVSQFMTFFANTVAARTSPGQRQSIEEGENYVGHVYARSEGVAAVIISDKEYPVRVAFSLLNKILEEYLVKYPASVIAGATTANAPTTKFLELDTYLAKYQDPQNADTIMRVQQELDETKIVLHKTIESVLDRGEKLDSLVDKSEALSASSRMFYKQAKKTNSCCVIC
ncbi:uncharacterized protein SAPINGB_P005328 [Magnusiomyces paraingens]|uniref:Synaptobrevin homolog YKT6 n=1 Tax=Magnusiomyces paraingens TaxID=2606893 RepID=A0A5E8C4F7_9ASCO|nr:uncharacterized protein SAPINGB_P005328 [Saprochaete ingens]VVT56841.1 unnamed protein product [Saprochaete ingens]